jgi:hypothetical protein
MSRIFTLYWITWYKTLGWVHPNGSMYIRSQVVNARMSFRLKGVYHPFPQELLCEVCALGLDGTLRSLFWGDDIFSSKVDM